MNEWMNCFLFIKVLRWWYSCSWNLLEIYYKWDNSSIYDQMIREWGKFAFHESSVYHERCAIYVKSFLHFWFMSLHRATSTRKFHLPPTVRSMSHHSFIHMCVDSISSHPPSIISSLLGSLLTFRFPVSILLSKVREVQIFRLWREANHTYRKQSQGRLA